MKKLKLLDMNSVQLFSASEDGTDFETSFQIFVSTSFDEKKRMINFTVEEAYGLLKELSAAMALVEARLISASAASTA